MITTLSFETCRVRVVTNDQGIPLWVVGDVCECLGIQQAGVAVDNHPADEVAEVTISHTSLNGTVQARKRVAVTEAGLYRLIFQSRKPEAERFKKWVFAEVLPKLDRVDGIDRLPLEEAAAIRQRAFAVAQAETRLYATWIGEIEAQKPRVALEFEVSTAEAAALRGIWGGNRTVQAGVHSNPDVKLEACFLNGCKVQVRLLEKTARGEALAGLVLAMERGAE